MYVYSKICDTSSSWYIFFFDVSDLVFIIFVLRIPINNLYAAFVSAIGRRSFTVLFIY